MIFSLNFATCLHAYIKSLLAWTPMPSHNYNELFHINVIAHKFSGFASICIIKLRRRAHICRLSDEFISIYTGMKTRECIRLYSRFQTKVLRSKTSEMTRRFFGRRTNFKTSSVNISYHQIWTNKNTLNFC